MKYYIATKLENAAAHRKLAEELKKMRHDLTYNWTLHGAVWSEGMRRIRDVATAEAAGVCTADCVIMLWPGGRGTHVELGMALALNKCVVIISNEEEHHRPGPNTCCFYLLPRVCRFRTVEEFLQRCRREPGKWIHSHDPEIFDADHEGRVLWRDSQHGVLVAPYSPPQLGKPWMPIAPE